MLFFLLAKNYTPLENLQGFIIVVLVFILLYLLRKNISKFKFSGKAEFSKQEAEIIRSYLSKHTYFEKLSIDGRMRFFNRVMKFMINKKFIGMEGLHITDEMRTRISACAVQLTFGLDEFMLPHFRIIRVFPKEFYSRFVERYLKGGATQSGIIMLSWNNFEEGYADSADKYNLGLHEMAHALILDMLHGTEENEQFQGNIIQWERAGDIEMEKLRKRQPHFLRAYGGTNEHEFFAVSVEHFFEAPEEFKKSLPNIYWRLSQLLNQDPTNVTGDYERQTAFGVAQN